VLGELDLSGDLVARRRLTPFRPPATRASESSVGEEPPVALDGTGTGRWANEGCKIIQDAFGYLDDQALRTSPDPWACG